MKCIQCGADLLESATFCARCGTPTRATTSFSYLPADAPPWPATVPQSTSLTATAVKDPAQSVATSDVGSAPDTKPKRSIGSIFTGFLLLLLSIVIGVGGTLGILALNGSLGSTTTTPTQGFHLATPIPTTAVATAGPGTPTAATPTPASPGNLLPTPNSFVLVKVAEIGVSLKYPAGWVQSQPQATSAGNTSVDFHPSQQLPVDITIGRLSAQNSATVTGTSEVNQANIQEFGTVQKLTNLQVLTNTPQHVTIGGVTWDEQDAIYTVDNNGNTVHVVNISVKHNNLYYNILYFAQTTLFDEAMQKYIQPMLTSFRFLP